MKKNALFALAALPVLVVSLAACSSSGSAAKSATPTPKAVSAQEWGVASAKCMRAAGHNVEDPSSGGGQGISLTGGDSIEKFAADQKKCDKEVAAKLGERPVSDLEKEQLKESNNQEDCLRKEGVSIEPGQALDASKVSDEAAKKCGVELGVSGNTTGGGH